MRAKPAVQFEMMGELLASLGVSASRVRLTPAPGTATVRDVARLLDLHKRKFELIDGTLVEKVMGAKEAFVATRLSALMWNWNEAAGNLGMILGADGPFHLMKKLVRIPDVSFTNWDRLPGRTVPTAPVPDVNPDLAVEVLSEGNSRVEMERKLKEYFLSEIEVVWFVDPEVRTVRVYTSPDDVTELHVGDTLTGGDVLPGFSVPVARLFADLGPAPPPTKAKPRKKR
jgi:Uma2 family endonuclease